MEMTFDVEWAGELAAGIRAGSETVTVKFEHTNGKPDADTVEFFREAIAEYFDGARVQLRA